MPYLAELFKQSTRKSIWIVNEIQSTVGEYGYDIHEKLYSSDWLDYFQKLLKKLAQIDYLTKKVKTVKYNLDYVPHINILCREIFSGMITGTNLCFSFPDTNGRHKRKSYCLLIGLEPYIFTH